MNLQQMKRQTTKSQKEPQDHSALFDIFHVLKTWDTYTKQLPYWICSIYLFSGRSGETLHAVITST
jgi:hypothetical protein